MDVPSAKRVYGPPEASLEEYRSGHNGLVSKTKRGASHTWVRIPPPPPILRASYGYFSLKGGVSNDWIYDFY